MENVNCQMVERAGSQDLELQSCVEMEVEREQS